MKQDPKKMKKVKALAKAADDKKPIPFWMKSKMGMKKMPSDNDGDE